MSVVTEKRRGLGWSQSKLAREAEMHPSTICQIENGRLVPYPAQARKLAGALGLSEAEVQQLVSGGRRE
jgi:ribosome-binding protein aMBF1 (putative translation factor)